VCSSGCDLIEVEIEAVPVVVSLAAGAVDTADHTQAARRRADRGWTGRTAGQCPSRLRNAWRRGHGTCLVEENVLRTVTWGRTAASSTVGSRSGNAARARHAVNALRGRLEIAPRPSFVSPELRVHTGIHLSAAFGQVPACGPEPGRPRGGSLDRFHPLAVGLHHDTTLLVAGVACPARSIDPRCVSASALTAAA
jgi:hypothetical protein